MNHDLERMWKEATVSYCPGDEYPSLPQNRYRDNGEEPPLPEVEHWSRT
jgi:hypothetical protein